jgi:hypothetical protein
MTFRSRFVPFLFVLASAVTVAPAARADLLYGLANTSQGIVSPDLISIDPTTGASTVIGSLGLPFDTINGLASYGGDLYTFDNSTNKVLQLDPASGQVVASTAIGLSGFTFEDALTFRSDGVGFIATSNGNLYSFNLATNSSSLIASNLPFNIAGITFSSSGVLYGYTAGASEFFTINPSTGATAAIGSLGNVPGIAGGLVFGSNGALYGILDDELNIIDPTTAGRTNVGPSFGPGAFNISGLGILASAVPEPSTIVLFGIGAVGIFSLSGSARRRLPRAPGGTKQGRR